MGLSGVVTGPHVLLAVLLLALVWLAAWAVAQYRDLARLEAPWWLRLFFGVYTLMCAVAAIWYWRLLW